MSGGSRSNRLRKLRVVEERIKRRLRFALILFFEAFVKPVELPVVRILLDLAVPFLGMALAQMPNELEKLLAR